MERFIEGGAFTGAVAAASRGGVIVLREASGHYTYECDAPAVREDMRYDLASVTKVTSVAILTLVDQREINLADPVQKYLPVLTGGLGTITIQQLLTHTSGLPSAPELHVRHPSRKDLEEVLFSVPLEHRPGSMAPPPDLCNLQYLNVFAAACRYECLDDQALASIYAVGA